MQIRRVLTLAAAAVALATAPTLVAQDNDKIEQREARDVQALLEMVNGTAAGTEPAPADFSVEWEGNHFMKAAGGGAYIPFTVVVDASQLAAPEAALYVRAVSKAAAAEPPAADASYAWDDVSVVSLAADGRLSRAMVLEPGEYDLFIAMKEQGPLDLVDPLGNAIPSDAAKAAVLRRDLTVPDFEGTDLTMSSVLIGTIEPLAAPLDEEQQRERPYTFGQMSVTPATDLRIKTSAELQALFWIYGAGERNSKPDVQIEYSFHRQTADGEVYFNKTPPQVLNSSTLPPQFDVATDQLPGMLFVPLASFPVGEYRLEIKLTDAISGNVLTHNATFIVEA
ncbi:MAG: hypothetical protein O2930_11205 [Acidobacteria bacterium]|nr:hypothetical protein [Chloroflexota bacterium]MDA1185197.1 hypothetical protein [Acidobacteriota bacterium]